MNTIYWLLAFIIFVGIEVATTALVTIWFAGGAFAAFLLSLLHVGTVFQLWAFVIISFLLLFLTRPLALKYVNGHTVKTNAEGLPGKIAKVTVEVNNRQGTGTAIVNGQEWTARSRDDTQVIPAGKMVEIQKIEGVKLIVYCPEDKKETQLQEGNK